MKRHIPKYRNRLFKRLIFILLGPIGVFAVWASEGTSPNYVLQTFAVTASGEQGSSPQNILRWSTTGETAGGLFTSTNYRILAGFISQIAQEEGGRNIGRPRTPVAVPRNPPPVITNLQPSEGSFTNLDQPVISAEYFDPPPEFGIDVDSVLLMVDGVDVTAESNVTETGVTYTPVAPLSDGEHSFTVDVSDLNGVPAQQAQSTFTVDTMPPILYVTTPVDQSVTGITPITVSGVVQDSSTVSVAINGTNVILVDNTFSALIDLNPGTNIIEVQASDQVNNQRQQIITVHLDVTAPVINITSPLDGGSVDYFDMTVEAVVDDSSAFVTVNNMNATMITPGVFRALHIPLVSGINIITATAMDSGGLTAEDTITVYANPQTQSIDLLTTPISGKSPLDVMLVPLPSPSLTNIREFQYDWEGNGTIDLVDVGGNPIRHVYSQVGQYFPSVTVKTDSEALFSAKNFVNVHEPEIVEGSIQISDPVDIEVDKGGLIYILSRQASEIRIYDFDEITMNFILRRVVSGNWLNPEGLDVEDDLNIFVADTGHHQIQKFIPDGLGGYILDTAFGQDGSIGTFGTGSGQFDSPFDVTADFRGMIFVSDRNNHRIQKFTENGEFILEFGGLGTDLGKFNLPKGLIFSPLINELFIVDSSNQRVQVFNSDGGLVGFFGLGGTGQGEFDRPANVNVDGIFDYHIVADQGNNRIQLFDQNGRFVQEITGLDLSAPQSAVGLSTPPNNIIKDQIIYICDTGNNRILRVNIPQDPGNEDPLTPYYDLIAALLANDLDGAVSTFVTERQLDRRAFFSIFLVNDPNGLNSLGQELSLFQDPVLVQREGDFALYFVARDEGGEITEYNLRLFQGENGEWRMLDF